MQWHETVQLPKIPAIVHRTPSDLGGFVGGFNRLKFLNRLNY
jgi:hypothetical protein